MSRLPASHFSWWAHSHLLPGRYVFATPAFKIEVTGTDKCYESLLCSGEVPVVQRILVPIDGTRSSASVVPYAADMAHRMVCELMRLRRLSSKRH